MATGGNRESDTFLLTSMRKGDTSAYETLFRRHYGTVYGVVYGLTGSSEAAEDLAQDTFLVFYRQPPALEEDRTLVAWLCRVALNKALNIMRGEQRAQAREELVARLDYQATSSDDPEAHFLRSEEHARICDALAQLSERQSKVLLLRTAGLSYAEVADLLDVAPGSVGTLLTRAERAFIEAYAQAESISLDRAQALRLQTEGKK